MYDDPKVNHIQLVKLTDFTVGADDKLLLRGQELSCEPVVAHHTGPFHLPLIVDFHAKKSEAIDRLIVTDADDLQRVLTMLARFPTCVADMMTGNCEEGLEEELFVLGRLWKLIDNLTQARIVSQADCLVPMMTSEVGRKQTELLPNLLRQAQDLSRKLYQSARHPTDEMTIFADPRNFSPLVHNAAIVVTSDTEGKYRFAAIEGLKDVAPFEVHCLMATTLCCEWSPALFAIHYADGTRGLVFAKTHFDRQRLLGGNLPDGIDLNYPTPTECLGPQIHETMKYLRQIFATRPVTPPESCADPMAEAMCMWFVNTIENWAKDIYVNVLELQKSFG